MPVNELLPFAAYDDPAELPPRRIATIMAVLWGVPFGLVMGLSSGAFNLVFSLVIGLLGGAAFGMLWTKTFRRKMIDLSRRLYESDPTLVPAPPLGTYRFRVLGNLFRGRIAVGGHLYAGVDRWVFVPHRKNLQRHQAPVEIEPSGAQVVASPMASAAKFMTGRPAFAVRIDDPKGPLVLKTPDPERVVTALGELRAERG